MRSSSLFLLGLAVAILSSASADAATKTSRTNTASTEIFHAGAHAKVLDPDIRAFAPPNAKTYVECKQALWAQGANPNYQYAVCSSMGYKN
jgi:hypothetical protein